MLTYGWEYMPATPSSSPTNGTRGDDGDDPLLLGAPPSTPLLAPHKEAVRGLERLTSACVCICMYVCVY